MTDERSPAPHGANPANPPVAAEISSDQAQRFLLSPIAVVCLAATAWILSLSLASLVRDGRGETSWSEVSQVRWDATCPQCGTVERVAQLREPHGPGRAWRIDVRMAGGQLRQVRSVHPLTPGQRVTVQEGRILPTAESAVCR